MTKDEIRARIDALECLSDVQQAIEEVQSVDWEVGDRGTLDVQVSTSGDRKSVTFIACLPPSVLLAGLKVALSELEILADVEVTA